MKILPTKKQWGNWSLPSKLTALGAYLGIVGLLLTILLWLITKPSLTKKEKVIPDEENKDIIKIFSWLDKIKAFDADTLTWSFIKKGFDSATYIDPYNVNAYLIRGQYFLSLGGLKSLPQVLSDYKFVVEKAPELADGHFGLGAVIYKISLFDLIKRQRFKVIKRGFLPGSVIGGDTLKLLTMPVFMFSPDHSSKLLLNLALREFQTVQTSKQLWEKSGDVTVIMSSIDNIDKYLRAVRYILNLEPYKSALYSDLNTASIEIIAQVYPRTFSKLFVDTVINDKSDIIKSIDSPLSTDINYLIAMGQKLEQENKPAYALEFFERALILNPNSFVSNFGEGNCFGLLSKYAEAVNYLDKALKISPYNFGPLFNREVCRLRSKGLQWPNNRSDTIGRQTMTFLLNELNNEDINNRLGATLLIIYAKETNYEEFYRNYPNAKKEFALIKFPKR